MINKLQYDFEAVGDASEKALVAIHGWQGNRNSMRPLIQSMNIKNVGWYLLEAPFPVEGVKDGYSWSYEISKGVWEEDKPINLLNIFFNDLFKEYSSKNIYIMGFSQGGLVCIDFVLFLTKPLGGVFPIAGFSRHPKVKIPRCHPCQKNTQIIIAHGRDDKQVPVSASVDIFQQLKEQGCNVELILYKGKHNIGIECLRKIKTIIQN